jgi:sigma-B regulation protein RsbU (phosphoserine phosphatase)
MAILKRVTGNPSGQIIELKTETIVIGRSPECQIILDPNGVSRRHAEIIRLADDFFIADLRSRNKTKVNGADLDPSKKHKLKPGDRINICDVEFVYYVNPPKGMAAGDELVLTDGQDDPAIHTLDASRSSTLASAVRPEVKLKAILEIARSLSTELRIDSLAPKILTSLMELFPQSERLFLILQDPETKRLVRKAFKFRPTRRPFGLSNDDEVPMSISRSIVNHVLVNKRAVLSQDAGEDKNLPTSMSIADLKIRSVMCVPLLTPDGQALGIIQLDTSDRKQFHQDDLDVLAAVASQAAIAIQNATLHEGLIARERIERDLKIAEQVQKSFLPSSVPKIPRYEFFAHYNPAYEVGGDYYDFVPLRDNRWAIALADVSGKGVAAALMMAKFSGDTRYCILTEDTLGKAAGALNELLCEAGIEEKFITMSLNLLDPSTDTLTLTSAGHIPVLVRRANGELEEVGEEIAGFPLGILPGTEYGQTQIKLYPGDMVIIYSDGLTDARSPKEELFDTRENRRVLKRVAELSGSPESVGKALLQDIREFSDGHQQADDITLICFGLLAP